MTLRRAGGVQDTKRNGASVAASRRLVEALQQQRNSKGARVSASRADSSQAFCSCCADPRGPSSSLHASIGAPLRHDAIVADERLDAETRFDPQRGPAAAARAERATSRLGRAAASQRIPTPCSAAPRSEWTAA